MFVLRGVIAAFVAGMLAAPSAFGAPPCERQPEQRVIASGFETLESVIADRRGRVYFTDGGEGRLMFMPRRSAKPRPVVDGIRAPGGLAFLPDGALLVGYGTSIPSAVTGFLNPRAGLIRYDPRTGEHEIYADGLTMANGVVRGPGGAIYASNDVGLGIDRVHGGEVERGWASVISSNGLAIDSTGTWLYAAQTFQPAAVLRIELADPTNVETWFRAPLDDLTAGPDGIARDEHDNVYVAANASGEIWRIAADGGEYCSLAALKPLGPSAVAFGRGSARFERRHLYVTTFQGELIQLKNVRG